MRGLCLASLLCSLVAAQKVFGFSGTFNSSSPTVTYNDYDSENGTCHNGMSGYYYAQFNYTFATAGVHTLFTFGIMYASVYTPGQTVDWENLCNASLPAVVPLRKGTGNFHAEVKSEFVHSFEAKSYTFIVMGAVPTDFVGELWGVGHYRGQTKRLGTNGLNRTWHPLTIPIDAQYGTSCFQSPDLYFYDTQVISVNETGYYNLYFAFAENKTNPVGYPIAASRSSFSILQGNFTDLSNHSCDASYVYGLTDGYVDANAFNMWLVANQIYTIVFTQGGQTTNGQSYFGEYSLTVVPARLYNFSSSATFYAPSQRICLDGRDCSARTDVVSTYGWTTFNVPQNSNFMLWADEDPFKNGHDLQFYLYSQYQTLPLLSCGPVDHPSCFAGMDSETTSMFQSGPYTNFTIIATYWSDSRSNLSASFSVFILTGPLLDAPTSSAAAPTPGKGGNPAQVGGAAMFQPCVALLLFVSSFIA